MARYGDGSPCQSRLIVITAECPMVGSRPANTDLCRGMAFPKWRKCRPQSGD
jgi:hypothetical protein